MKNKDKKFPKPMIIGDETFGRRLARIRKEKGYTQVELSKKMDMIQVLISDYEHDKLRPHHEIIARFAKALGVSADALLGLEKDTRNQNTPSLKIQRRMSKIEQLPPSQQRALLQTIDAFVKGVGKQ